MSNDRVMVRCKGCGAIKNLLSMSPGSLAPVPGTLDWMARHGACNPNLYHGSLEGEPGLELVTEVGTNWKQDRLNAEPPEHPLSLYPRGQG